MEDPHPLELHRVYGFSSGVPGGVVDLRTKEQNLVGYAAGHTVVLLDVASKDQMILQGHVHAISCIKETHDKKCLVSADCGTDAVLILWSCSTGQVMQAASIKKSGGIIAMEISSDDHFLVTLTDTSKDQTQELKIWHIKAFESGPLATVVVPFRKQQMCVQWDKSNSNEFVTNGKDSVFFWRQHKETTDTESTHSLTYLRAVFKVNEVKEAVGPFTVSSFLIPTFAITGTMNGDVIVWDTKRISPQVQEDVKSNTKGSLSRAVHALKVVKLHSTAITTLVPIGQCIVTGGADGFVRFYDSRLVLVAWLDDLNAGDITSISFSSLESDNQSNSSYALPVPSFVIGTKKSHILLLHAGMFEEAPESPQSKGQEIIQCMSEKVQSISTHPRLPRFTTISLDGFLQVFDYKKNRVCKGRCFQELQGSTVKYSPSGTTIACGFANGALKVHLLFIKI